VHNGNGEKVRAHGRKLQEKEKSDGRWEHVMAKGEKQWQKKSV
jgi:hypothetical protein